MRQERECQACGGTGREYCECGGDSCDYCFNSLSDPCLVCLGSGRVSDVIPARDAVADAETLRLVGLNSNIKASTVRLFVLEWTLPQFPDHSTAKHAARAAFRAVPGLRA